MPSKSGFTPIQLNQLKALLAEERKQTKALLAEERKQTKALLAEERKYNDRKRNEQTTSLKQFTQDEVARLKRSLTLLLGKTKNQLQQSIATLATHSPTRKEFDQLKDKVDFYHPESPTI